MNMQVHIYLSANNQIQVVLQGPAHGAATFRDMDTFVRFIEGCQDFIKKHAQAASAPDIPQPFLDAFDDSETS